MRLIGKSVTNERRAWAAALAWMAVLGLAAQTSLAQEEFRGLWADALHLGFRNAGDIDELIARAVEGHYNAISAEVLAYYDAGTSAGGAYWDSAYVPKATNITPAGFDPLAYLCQQGHAYGLEVHAWLVTYRVMSDNHPWPPSGNPIIAAHPEWIAVPSSAMGNGPALTGSGSDLIYMLDPGSPEVQDYLLDIVRELVTNYPIDGLNWDYIRYTTTDAGYPSSNTYYYSGLKRYQRISGDGTKPVISNPAWCDFRRRTINEMIRRCRAEIPMITVNPRQPLRLTADVLATGSAPSDFTSSLAYSYFQNWKYWLEQGWLDAAMPMNYKREHCADQAAAYISWLNAAVGYANSAGRHAYCGQGNYLNSMANSVHQLGHVSTAGAQGSVNYSYWATNATETVCESPAQDPWEHNTGWFGYVAANLFTSVVPTPTMPWRNPATATEGTIWGRITTASTGDPVDNAQVQVGTRPSVTTDGSGCYVITLVPAPTGSSTAYSLTAIKGSSTNHPQAWVFAGDVSRYDLALGTTGSPRLLINGGDVSISLARNVGEGQNLPDGSLAIAAQDPAANGPVNYIITTDAEWVATTPTRGTSNGETNTVIIVYDTAALAVGAYSTHIAISDAKASNSPLTVTINLSVVPPPVPVDFDGDRDVDQVDLAHMQVCLSGSTVPQDDPDCQNAKLDGDGDVDQDDMTKFLGCMTGPGIYGDPNCLNR
jgi:uncharacterized lipoprotein YddW (UPF0748 family)